MPNTYLTVGFHEKDAAKALGARWDGAQRQWYVPEGRELAPFTQWLPAGEVDAKAVLPSARQIASATNGTNTLAIPDRTGVALSALLAGVSQAVAAAYRNGVWVLVEVVELRTNGGHVFMGVSERDSGGSVLAKTTAVIWQSTANTILPEFERATGAQLAPGIKLLVRARPTFKPIHGFTIEVDAIDPEYTLGDLEARKREIRTRLQAEGVFTANKQLPAPWDFNSVLVVAPAGGAGLGDFQAEANRLQHFGVCEFVYAFSRFQGEGAAREIGDALQQALAEFVARGESLPDAVVIIRGGGAVNDLAWLNDYDLARYICDLAIPVLTGIGHERDSTVLDEVANTKYDTPSKVIAGIEQIISKRVAEAKSNFEQISLRANRAVQTAKTSTTAMNVSVRSDAVHHLTQGKQSSAALIQGIRLSAMREIRTSSENSSTTFAQVRSGVIVQVQQARQLVPMLWNQVSMDSKRSLTSAASAAKQTFSTVMDETRRSATLAKTQADGALSLVSTSAKQKVKDATLGSEALMREIAGQGPEKTLKRGFALVRDPEGVPITRAAQAQTGRAIEIQFSDGSVTATAQDSV
ncbi:MAG: exodeoxyribonuclease VII large subunit [Candidatus Saccharibacteria bacterium]|nr:exodeoxyribonuclease VII large subunit [Rhodoferax sp.]